MLYFRSDSRPPHEIYRNGFIPRGLEEKWTIATSGLDFCPHLEAGITTGARSFFSVCFTTNFHAAPMFPIDSGEDTFIYCIFLPDPIPITINLNDPKLMEIYESSREGSVFSRMRKFTDWPELAPYYILNGEKKVFNLNSLQFLQASMVVKQQMQPHPPRSREQQLAVAQKAGWMLHASEMITNQIRSEDIYAAIHCYDRRFIDPDALEKEYTGLETPNYQTEFRIQKPLIVNPYFRFAEHEAYKMQDLHRLHRFVSAIDAERTHTTTHSNWGHVWSL